MRWRGAVRRVLTSMVEIARRITARAFGHRKEGGPVYSRPMIQGLRFVSPLGLLSFGAILALALAAPTEASAAPKGKAGKAEEPEAEERDGESESEAAGDGEAKVSVSTSGATTSESSGASTGKKGAPMKGRFGLGALRTVSGLNGLFGRYYLGNRFTLGLNAGFATFSHRDTDDDGELTRTRTVGAFAVGPEVFFWPVQGDRSQQVHADFGVGGRVLTYVGFLGLRDEQQSNTLDTPVEIDVEIPAAVQVFIGQRVSINPEFGFVVRIIPGSREPDRNGDFDMNPGTGIGQRLGTTSGPGLGFEVGSHAGFFMGIGVGYYFGKLPG
jgi:hypothetical protein